MVIDFGVAKATNQNLTDQTIYTRLHQIVGTTLYMSPEQAELSRFGVDTRTDIYSLGVLLYEMLAGTTPFDRERFKQAALDEVRRIIREEEPPKPSTRLSTLGDTATKISSLRSTEPQKLRHSLRGDLDWIVMMAIDKDRDRRYETANGLAMDVTRFLNDEPILARQPSVLYRISKLYRRNQWLVTSATVVLAALIIGLGVALWALQLAHEQKAIANQRANDLKRAIETSEQQKERARYHNYLSDLNYSVSLWEKGNVDQAIDLLKHWHGYEHAGLEYNFVAHLVKPRSMQRHQTPLTNYDLACAGDGFLVNVDQKPVLMSQNAKPKTLPGTLYHSSLFKGNCSDGAGMQLAYLNRKTANDRQKVTIFDLETDQSRPFESEHEIISLAVTAQGTLFAGSDNGTLYVQTADGKTHEFDKQITELGEINEVAVPPNGSLVAIADKSVLVYQITYPLSQTSLRRLARLDLERAQSNGVFRGVEHLAISSDGELIAFSQFAVDHSIHVHSSSGEHLATLSGPENLITEIQFSPIDDLLFASSRDGTIRVWDSRTFVEIAVLRGQSSYVLDFDISPDGRKLFSTGLDGGIIEWDIHSIRNRDAISIAEPPIPSHVGKIVFDSESKAFYACGFSLAPVIGLVKFDLENQSVTKIVDSPVRSFAIHHALQVAACQVRDPGGGLEFWSLSPGSKSQEPFRPLPGHKLHGLAGRFSPDGRKFLQGLHNRETNIDELHLFDFDPQARWVPTPETLIPGSKIFAWSSLGEVVATARENDILFVDPESRTVTKTIATDHSGDGGILSLRFSPDSRLIASCGFDSEVRVWDTQTSNQVCPTLRGHTGKVWDAAFSSDNTRLFTVGGDGNLTIWNTQSGDKLVSVYGHVGGIGPMAINEDDSLVVTGGLYDGKYRIWKLDNVTGEFWD